MYTTKELRWFFKEDAKSIRHWFANHNIKFSNTPAREDFYLPLREHPEINIKLRGGKIEIKTRAGKRVLRKINKNISGYQEEWTKWSFLLQENDPVATAVIDNKKAGWLKMKKTRLGLKISEDKYGVIRTHHVDTDLENGSQIEYTKIIIKGSKWYTFAVENLGNTGNDLYIPFIKEMTAGVTLNKIDSMGYTAFLNQFI